MRVKNGVAVVGLILMSGVFIHRAFGQQTEPVSEALTQTQATVQAIEVSQQLIPQVVTGALLGLGAGIVIGSTALFYYWDQKLS